MDSRSSSTLNDPLYRFSGNDISSAPSRKVKGDQYLPPYRYDDNEAAYNKYLASDEAYATVAKALLFEVGNNIGDHSPYDIVIRTLAISQIKMFADAHMEKALLLPTFPERFEAPNIVLMRKIDSVFGSVLLEFYATKDGILLGPQVEMLTKNDMNQEEKKMKTNATSIQNYDSPTTTTTTVPTKKVDHKGLEVGKDEDDHSFTKYSMSTAGKSKIESDMEVQEDENVINFSLDSASKKERDNTEGSFDEIYNTSMHEVGNNPSFSDRSTQMFTSASKSKLKKEIISEIDRVKLEIQNTDSQDEKQTYQSHLKSLLSKLDQFTYIEEFDEEESPCQVERYAVRTNTLGEEETPLPKSRRFFKENATKNIATTRTKQTAQNRGIMSTPSYDRSMQSRGFVHIKDMERGFKIVKVIAHEDMKDGVLFQAKYREQHFTIRVPMGGVKEGEIFSSPVLHPSDKPNFVVHYECLLDTMEVPKGRWRDRLFQCFNDPMLCMSCLCPNAALSQIRTRMKFQDIGEVTCGNKVKSLVCFNLLLIFLNMWTILALVIMVDHAHLWLVIACWVPLGIIDVYLVYKFITLTLRTRREVKARHQIYDNEIEGAIEAFMITLCSCCVISQMGRHTADYKTFREEYLSATGLPPSLELLVPLVPKKKYNSNGDDDDDEHVC